MTKIRLTAPQKKLLDEIRASDCDRHGPPRTLAWKLSSVAGTTMIVADNILHAVKREAKMWTWHR